MTDPPRASAAEPSGHRPARRLRPASGAPPGGHRRRPEADSSGPASVALCRRRGDQCQRPRPGPGAGRPAAVHLRVFRVVAVRLLLARRLERLPAPAPPPDCDAERAGFFAAALAGPAATIGTSGTHILTSKRLPFTSTPLVEPRSTSTYSSPSCLISACTRPSGPPARVAASRLARWISS